MIRNNNQDKLSANAKKKISAQLSILFMLFLVMNLNHNWKVAGESRNRSFQYQAWQTLTKDSKTFNSVKSGDLFISNNQNDAFETNAGSFYFNSGIRLAYMFRTDLIWPNYSECNLDSNCNLTEVRKKSVSTIPNLTRGVYAPTRIGSKKIDDWVGINSRPGALSNNTIWAFDMFLLTESTYVSYLAPFVNDETRAMVDSRKLQVVTITNKKNNELRPAIANFCLVEAGKKLIRSGEILTRWKIPSSPRNPSGLLIPNRSEIDLRELQIGTCQLE